MSHNFFHSERILTPKITKIFRIYFGVLSMLFLLATSVMKILYGGKI